jgi:hypothetical protein
MLFHLFKLWFGEFSRFQQNAVRNLYLADVMQRCLFVQQIDGLIVQALDDGLLSQRQFAGALFSFPLFTPELSQTIRTFFSFPRCAICFLLGKLHFPKLSLYLMNKEIIPSYRGQLPFAELLKFGISSSFS